MHMVEYADKRMRAMGVTQTWLHNKGKFTLGRQFQYHIQRKTSAGELAHLYLVNIAEPMIDVMSLLYTRSELMGYVKSIRIWHADPAKTAHAEDLKEQILYWLTEVMNHPLSFNKLKTVKVIAHDGYVKTLHFQKTSTIDQVRTGFPTHSVTQLASEIPEDRWVCREAYDRMVEGDAVNGPSYTPDPNDPEILGYGIVCTGMHTWEHTET